MAFQEGHKLAKGRPRGSVNRSTAEVRELFSNLLTDNLETLQNDIGQLSPKDRVRSLLELAKFVLPTMKSLDVRNDEKEEPRIFEVIIHPPLIEG